VRTIEATLPVGTPPAWAVLERHLFELLDQVVEPFVAKYTRADGTLIWPDEPISAGSADDPYEAFYNWPLLYALGGGDHLLTLAAREWEAVTRQLTAHGLMEREYYRAHDWFHQSEGNLFFYYLCLADPARPARLERARRFAGFYTGEDPAVPNYDPARRIIRAAVNGSGGPRFRAREGEPVFGYYRDIERYGLPYYDVPGIARNEDLKRPELARRMGEAMEARMARGDAVANLAATGLVTNAYLLTGEDTYRRWVLDYVDAWVERARRNGGLVPDNVGLSGVVGEYTDGHWYGAYYGWVWPHGFYNVAQAAIVGATCAFLLSGDASYLDLPRAQIDHVLALGEVRDPRAEPMSLREHWVDRWLILPEGEPTLLVPYRYNGSRWFDYQPMHLAFPTTVWNLSMAPADWERLERIRAASNYDWRASLPFHNKEENGHEAPWLRFLAGDNPSYPEDILRTVHGQVLWKMDGIRGDRTDMAKAPVDVHLWQELNPVYVEALLQLTLGAPQVTYNGGLLVARLRYFDPVRRRPGLPPDVAALVEMLEPERTVVQLVNLSPDAGRDVVVQAGGLGEHRFAAVRYGAMAESGGYPGPVAGYSPPAVAAEERSLPIDDRHVRVRLRPGRRITLDFDMRRFVNRPSYAISWPTT
jgi:hypothetical protein